MGLGISIPVRGPSAGTLLDRYPSLRWIPHVIAPVLQFHGDDDSRIPFSQGQRCSKPPSSIPVRYQKTVDPMPGGEHNFFGTIDMRQAIRELFLQIDSRNTE